MGKEKSSEDKGLKLRKDISLGGKEPYIEYLRAMAAVTVVLLHIVMTLPANNTVSELGLFNSAVLNGCYMPTKWAVPCFVMISGALLLKPSKTISIEKIAKYIRRMLLVLLLFGTSFALMELVFNSKTINVGMIFRALVNTAEEKSWSHLWYIYVLISLYLITIPLKYAIERMSSKELDYMVYILVIGNFVIPLVNVIVGTEICQFMILTEYTTYYIIGYWLTTKNNRMGKLIIIPAIVCTMVMIALDVWSLYNGGQVFELNHQSEDILTLIQSICVFIFFKEVFSNRSYGKLIKIICECSFGIYIIHPFWINIIYKVVGITPLSMPIALGIISIFIIVFVLALISTMILKKLYFIKNLI